MREDKVQEFLDYLLVEKGYSDNTIVAYRNDLSQLVDFLTEDRQQPDDIDWKTVDRDTFLSFNLSLLERRYKPSTRARKMAAAKSFFHYLFQSGTIADDPTASLGSPHVEKPLPKAASREDIERLLSAPEGDSPKALRDRAILELLYATGMRVTELTSLDLGNVDLDTGTVRVFGKGAKERLMPIHPRSIEALESYLGSGRPALVRDEEEHALFLNPRGKRLTRQGLWLIVKQYVYQEGLDTEERKFTPHTLRHSFATHMLKGGANLRNVQHLLGHASLATTQVYTKVDNAWVREEYDKGHPRAKETKEAEE